MRIRLVALGCLAVILGGAASARALQAPGRTLTRKGPVVALGVTHASVAFAVGRTSTDCDHVELWNTDTTGAWRFGRARACGDVPLFKGIAGVAVASKRVVWVSYAGGNDTDWQLWTATPTKRAPHQIRFVERPTGDPAPIVVGEGTLQAVPYAIDDEVTWLADDGAPVFRWAAPSAVRAVTSGDGPSNWRVAALLANGDVTVLNGSGAVAQTYSFGSTPVTWIALAPRGLLVQLPGGRVEVHRGGATTSVQLEPGARVVDFAEGRLLYQIGQSFRLRRLATGEDTQLLQGSKRRPILASLDTHGLAWAQGGAVHWACAVCVP